MGWCADALKDGKYVDVETDEHARSVFLMAAKTAESKGGVDDFLKQGGVGLSRSRHYLRQAVGRDVNCTTLSPSDVTILSRECEWPDEESIDPNDTAAYWSIRLLISTCAENGYGLDFG